MAAGGIARKQASYRNMDERFKIEGEAYRGQKYSHIYFIRLHHVRNFLLPLIPSWKPNLPVTTVLGLVGGKECVIIGTLYKHMKLKPSILEEYSKERSAVPLVKPHNFIHPDDLTYLEDESGRVKLSGLDPSVYVTGVVVALHGMETTDGHFLVHNVLEAGLPPQIELPVGTREDKFVILVSGLCIGGGSFNPLQFQLLIDHITGHLGDENEQRIASMVVHLIIAGNSVQIPQGFFNGQTLAAKEQSKLVEPVKELDIFLAELVAALPVDIMPGSSDPANFSLPQQFLGTSGQNIDDLYKYSNAKDRIEYMERTLRWRHIAPTTPNSLQCFPFVDKDPFLIETCPHVYFVGNQDKYETKLIQGPQNQTVRLICVPRFCDSGVAVMLNLRNLECNPLHISTDLK